MKLLKKYENLASMYESGMSLGQIALRFKVSRQAIHYALKRREVKLRLPKGRYGDRPETRSEKYRNLVKMYNDGMTMTQLADVFKVTYPTIREALKIRGAKFRRRGPLNKPFPSNKEIK